MPMTLMICIVSVVALIVVYIPYRGYQFLSRKPPGSDARRPSWDIYVFIGVWMLLTVFLALPDFLKWGGGGPPPLEEFLHELGQMFFGVVALLVLAFPVYLVWFIYKHERARGSFLAADEKEEFQPSKTLFSAYLVFKVLVIIAVIADGSCRQF